MASRVREAVEAGAGPSKVLISFGQSRLQISHADRSCGGDEGLQTPGIRVQ
jgi:hypothetical protein